MSGFISYARNDRAMLDRLLKHLASIERQVGWKFWHDQYINAGDLFDARIQQAIDSASLFILFMSADFLASTYIWNEELPAIRKRRDADPNGVLIIRAILHPCTHNMVSAKRQAVPSDTNGRLLPISLWPDREHGFDQARAEILAAMTAYTLLPTAHEDL